MQSLCMKKFLTAGLWLAVIAGKAAAADLPVKAPPQQPADWTGFYLGGHLGYAWGNSNWSTPGISGSFGLGQPIDTFNESGSFFAGVHAGYNYMLPNRFVVGVEADASFPSFPNLAGISIGGSSTLSSPFGPETYLERMVWSGTLRGRVGYAPGSWLFYATGGFAWSYDQLTLTNLETGATDMPFLWRLGWTAGMGVEAPVAPHWTARLEYLFTDYGNSSVSFANNAQTFTANFLLQELRAGVDYHFGSDPPKITAPATPDPDILNFHGQTTFSWQGYPAFRSPYEGANSLPGSGQGREVVDATLTAGVRLWQGAEAWIDPEIDQGFGLGDTHGVAGFTSGETYKFGSTYPYARVQRYFIRQTIDLGGDEQKVDADFNKFAGSQTTNRLVLTIGKFGITDLFDTNKYANSSKTDFLNWSLINAGTFDYAGDAWGYTYGAAAEWYQGDWTLRGGVFDLSATPAGGVSPLAYGLDPTFDQFQLVGEIERRYSLWDQPGAIKVTGFLSRGRAGGEYDLALKDYDQAIQINPNAASHYNNRGIIYRLKHDYDRAIADYDEAIWLKSDYVAAFYNRALTYVDKGDYGRALADIGVVLQFNPKSALALYARGWMLLKKGDTEAGDADIAAAKAIDPNIADQFDPSN
jgi:high affinity Mn2+ porin